MRLNDGTSQGVVSHHSRMGKSNGLHALEVAHLIIQEIVDATRETRAPDPTGARHELARTANAVAANIAEGYGRDTTKERNNGLRGARGELEEAQSHLKVAALTHSISQKRFYRIWNLSEVLHRMLAKLMRRP